MFGKKIKFLKPRGGERFASALANVSLSNKVYKKFGKISIKNYIEEFVSNLSNK
jgi:UDP-glucose 4-epimerase